jgi:hypothetical protein
MLLLWLSLCGVMPVPSRAAEPVPGAAGPLTWQASTLPPDLKDSQAVAAALRYVDRDEASGAKAEAFVAITDKTPYGSYTTTVFFAWLVKVHAVAVSGPEGAPPGSLDVTVIVNSRDQVLEAVFPSAGNAKDGVPGKPSAASAGPFEETAKAGWHLTQPASPGLRSNVAEILAAFWRQTGLDPGTAGPWLLRPRLVSLAPAPGPVTYWMLQLGGTQASGETADRGGRPGGGRMALFEDSGTQSQLVASIDLP